MLWYVPARCVLRRYRCRFYSILLRLRPRIFQSCILFIIVGATERERQLYLELHASSVVELEDLFSKKQCNIRRGDCDNLVVMHNPVLLLQLFVLLQVEQIYVSGVIRVAWVFVGSQAFKPFAINTHVIANGAKARQRDM